MLGESFNIIQDGIADLRDKILEDVGLNGNSKLVECRKRKKMAKLTVSGGIIVRSVVNASPAARTVHRSIMNRFPI